MGHMRTAQERADNIAKRVEQVKAMLESGRCIVTERIQNGRKEIVFSLI